ncbi:Calx-beta domain-containing protein [Rubripirellula lacrimiformis]|uniref:Calx-beta domain-containing protein n=1 Tax=Rubripirellula lacrimiformis TaxID=1930273 RepID=UPI001C54CAC6|nr:Calx-beta domain-containing protein [Rubripirellula lacrimiformis]
MTQRRLGNELLEKRELLAGDILASQHNYWNGYDVNDDHQITSRDALAIINQLGRQNSGESEVAGADGPQMFYDVNADNAVTAADALSVINALGRGEEAGELVELMLNARTTGDEAIATDAGGAINVNVGEAFDLEITYDDLRLFNNRLGSFQLFTDIEAFDSNGDPVAGVISPVLNETQRLIIDEDINTVASTAVVFSIPELPPGAQAGATLTYTASITDFANNTTDEVSSALQAFGYTTSQFEISSLTFDNADLGFEIHFTGDEFGNIDLPNISVDVIESNAADTINTQTVEFAPFLPDGVTPNSAAVQFNINSFSRTYNDNEEYYSSLNRGGFSVDTGFTDIGGLANKVPLEGGGIPDVTDDGSFIEPFDAFSVRVFINQPINGLRLQLTPGEDREATLLYGRDDFVPQDLVLIEDTDTNNNGTAQLIVNAIGTVVSEGAFSIDPASVTVSEADGTATFTVNRTGGTSGAVTVDFATANGTATAGSDYTANSGTLNFADGESSKTVTVSITDDSDVEGDENFTVTISNATGGATLGTVLTSTVTISDNDVAVPGTFAIAPATTTVNENANTVTFTVTRSGGTDGTVTVDFATADGTATAGSDYAANNGTLTFADGESSKTITVSITDDSTADEPNETFTVTLSNATGGAALGGVTASTVTIVDNDNTVPVPGVFSIAPETVSVNESDGTATFTINRSTGSDGAVTVNFATANGTATAGSDYTANSGTLNFADGELSKTVTVAITDDADDEPNETFTVSISSATGGATLGAVTTSTATIVDNDATPVPGVLSISPETVSVNEDVGTATFTVNRTGGSDGAVTVNFATANGSATAGSDYTSNSGTLSFADGETSKTVTVAITDDSDVESNETFTVSISGASGGATLGSVTTSTATIVDNDAVVVPGVLSLSPATVSVNEDAGTVVFTVNRTGGSDGAVTVNFATSNGSATAGSDYTSNSGTLSFADGETSKTVSVSIIDDSADEAAEDFTISIGGPTGGATLGTVTTATATIVDNDDPVNNPPTSAPVTVTGVEDTASTFTSSTLLANASPGTGESGSQSVSISSVAAASTEGGQVVLNSGGNVSYTPAADFFGSDTFNVTITDTGSPAKSATFIVTVVVASVNDAPTAVGESASVFSGTTTNISVLGNDSAGPANEPQGLTLVSATSTGGTTSVNGDGTIAFTPNAGVTSTTISYTIRDTEGATATATVDVTVQDFIPAVITGSVFIDSASNLDAVINQGAAPVLNGVKDDGEQGLAGIVVRLTDSTGATVAAVQTGADGQYRFENVAPGDYTVVYDLPNTLLPIGETFAPISVASDGTTSGSGPNMSLLGTQGSAIENSDILASSYLRTHQNIAEISQGGREGGLASLDGLGGQEFLILGAGYDGVESAEFVLSDSGDTALLVIVEEGESTPSVARLSAEYFVVTPDGRGVQFFGGLDDFDFVPSSNEAISEEFSNFRSAIDRAMADM